MQDINIKKKMVNMVEIKLKIFSAILGNSIDKSLLILQDNSQDYGSTKTYTKYKSKNQKYI